jgi:hypothetical protein
MASSPGIPGPPRYDSPSAPVLGAAVWLAAAVLGYFTLGRGWFPHDAGALGQASARVLGGELPHRDFFDTYTGGLAFLNAGAFRLMGEGVLPMRMVFFAAFLIWVGVFWDVARRLAGPRLGSVATLLAAASSLPVYPEGMPSWYNLFLATGGVWALLRFDEDGRRRWLVAAGFAGGVSILFKIIGLFYLAGAGLYLLYRERHGHPQQPNPDAPPTAQASDFGYRLTVLSGLAFVGAALSLLVLRSGSLSAFVYFGVPPLAALAVVAARLVPSAHVDSRARFAALGRVLVPLAVGVAVPVSAFLVPYLLSGSLGLLWEGVFVLPQRRFQDAASSPPALVEMGPTVAVVLLAWLTPRLPGAAHRPAALVLGGILMVGLASSGAESVYRLFWSVPAGGGVVLAVAAAWAAGTQERTPPASVLVLSVFALCNLVQVPFAAPVYVLYAFPLLVLLALSSGTDSVQRRRWTGMVLVALLVFTVARVDTGFLYHLGFRYRPHSQTERLDLPRAAGIRVSPAESAEYAAVIRTLDALDPGEYILAFPDAPEIYFLSGLRNPTPLLFDFLQPDPDLGDALLLEALDRHDIRVVVLNRRPFFSPLPGAAFLEGLAARYPRAREVGRFVIFWSGP